jgi:hypothetical protein
MVASLSNPAFATSLPFMSPRLIGEAAVKTGAAKRKLRALKPLASAVKRATPPIYSITELGNTDANR